MRFPRREPSRLSPALLRGPVARMAALLAARTGSVSAPTEPGESRYTGPGESVRGGNVTIPRPALRLADPTNRDSEVGPQDLEDSPEYNPPQEHRDLLRTCQDRFRQSADARRPHEAVWIEGLAMYKGRQWEYWNCKAGRMDSYKDTGDPDRVYAVSNKITPKIRKSIARALQAKIDASIRPQGRLPSDIAAASEARAVLDHADQVNDLPGTLRRLIRGSHIIGPHFELVFFDPDEEVPVPEFDANLQHIGTHDAKVGEIRTSVVSCFEVYPDPKADTWDHCQWLIHACLRPVEYVAKKFPEYGKYVKGGNATTGPAGEIENLLNGLTRDTNKNGGGNTTSQNVVLCKMWEKPSRSYEQGREVWWADDVLLWAGDWLYPDLKHFPLIPLEYEEGLETLWGDNAITCAVEPQKARNRAVSKMQEHLKNGDGKILMPRGCEISPNAFKSGKRNEIIPYTVDQANLGHMPQLFPTPQLDPVILEAINLAEGDIADLLQVHEVSQGMTPPGVTAASAIQSLADQDTSDSLIYQSNLQSFIKRRAEVIVTVSRQVYIEPRLLAVRDTPPETQDVPAAQAAQERMAQIQALQTALGQAGMAPGEMPGAIGGAGVEPPSQTADIPRGINGAEGSNPDPANQPRSQAFTFKHLAEGRFVVEVGTSVSKTPAARIQTILDMAQRGMFFPDALPTTIALLRIMEIEQSDKLISDLTGVLSEMDAKRQAAADQQHQNELDAVQAKSAAQGQGAQAAAPAAPPPPRPDEVETAKAQAGMALADQAAKHKGELIAAETHAKMELADREHQHNMEEIAARLRVDAHISDRRKNEAESARAQAQFAPPSRQTELKLPDEIPV